MATKPAKVKLDGTAKGNVAELLKSQDNSGLNPHEILLKAARGEPFRVRTLVIVRAKSTDPEIKDKELRRYWDEHDYYPTYAEQIEAAKQAAPYFAPKLAAQTVRTEDSGKEAIAEALKQISEALP